MGDVSKRKDFNRRIERKVPGEWWARCTPPRRPIPLTSFVAFRTFCLSRIPSKTTWQQRKGTGSGRLLYSLCQNEDLFLDPLVYRLDWRVGTSECCHLRTYNKGEKKKGRHRSSKTIFWGQPFGGSKSLTCGRPNLLSRGQRRQGVPPGPSEIRKLTPPWGHSGRTFLGPLFFMAKLLCLAFGRIEKIK